MFLSPHNVLKSTLIVMLVLVHYKILSAQGWLVLKDININEHIWMDLILVRMNYTAIKKFQTLIRDKVIYPPEVQTYL